MKKSDLPNWFQRVRISIGIIEFYLDTFFLSDVDNEHLFLCSNLFQSFGFQNNFEAKVCSIRLIFIEKQKKKEFFFLFRYSKMFKFDQIVSMKIPMINLCSFRCEKHDEKCLENEYLRRTLNDLKRFLVEFLLPDGNSTFIQSFDIYREEFDKTNENDSNLFLQNLKNFLWSQIEFQMNKITKKQTKTPPSHPSPSPIHSIK